MLLGGWESYWGGGTHLHRGGAGAIIADAPASPRDATDDILRDGARVCSQCLVFPHVSHTPTCRKRTPAPRCFPQTLHVSAARSQR
jgi:hypothetical protein